MRVAYALTWSRGSWSGVFKKVADQVRAWTDLGAEVGVFVITEESAANDWRAVPEVRMVKTYRGRLSSVPIQVPLFRAIERWSPDVTYIRTTPLHAVASRSLGRLLHVVEIQSDDLAEAKLGGRRRTLVIKSTRATVHKDAAGLVFVTNELAAAASYQAFTPRRTVIGNGIDLSRLPTLPDPPPGAPPTLVFMGHPGQPWHGVEDVIALAAARPHWHFDIVGMSAVDLPNSPSNVRLHGELASHEYLPILAHAHVGIGSLALYRNGMEEASPLKVREYLGLGLPVVGAYRDTDIPPHSDMFLQLPNQPHSLTAHAAELDTFIESWRHRRVKRDDIAFLDTRVKEAKRLSFLAACSGVEWPP